MEATEHCAVDQELWVVGVAGVDGSLCIALLEPAPARPRLGGTEDTRLSERAFRERKADVVASCERREKSCRADAWGRVEDVVDQPRLGLVVPVNVGEARFAIGIVTALDLRKDAKYVHVDECNAVAGRGIGRRREDFGHGVLEGRAARCLVERIEEVGL
jgi:hypothetical protein